MMMNNNYKLQNTACCVKHTMQRCYIAPEIRAFANNLDRYFASCYAPAANNLLRSFSSTSHHSSLKKDNASTKMKKNKFNKFRLIFSLNNFLKHMTLNNICFSLFVIFITILLRYNGVSPLVFWCSLIILRYLELGFLLLSLFQRPFVFPFCLRYLELVNTTFLAKLAGTAPLREQQQAPFFNLIFIIFI